ncbi:hypothetical protein G3436_25885, partial [Pseudomonas sp. MAFF212427]
VIIGDVSRPLEHTGDFGYDVAVITPVNILKGIVSSDIRVAFNGPVSESRPRCCEKGGRYLFFIAKNPSGDYYSINGLMAYSELIEQTAPQHREFNMSYLQRRTVKQT